MAKADDPESRPRNGGSRPVPDPTVLTTQLVDRALEAERLRTESQLDVLRERLKGIDKATELLAKNVEFIHSDVISDIGTAVGGAVGVINERFDAIAQQFVERDARSETVSTLNKVALDAAFAAQKEAAAEQNKSNTLAITKSETATTETINKLAELFRTTTDGLSDKIDDIKARMGAVDGTLVGLIQNAAGGESATAESRAAASSQRQIVTVGISAILLIIAVVGFVLALQAKP